jgi:adenine-specific DNA-methyltransferase
MTDSKALLQLKSFLNKLFQFESQDLDFGIYKILQYKRKEVKYFIDTLLTDKVRQQLQVFDATQKEALEKELKEQEADETIINYNIALTDEAEAKVLYKYNKPKIDAYLKIKKQVAVVQKIDNTEETIYNHLTLFLSRYYDKGDFVSKRRFGKNEKYVVPYNGEETYFYWANHDQYYIKSSEYFQHFAFKVPTLHGTLTVNFKLAEAQTEQGNVKAGENKYFVLSETCKPELAEGHPEIIESGEAALTIFFEFRPLTDTEKKSFTGNGKQDTLNERAAAALKTQLGANPATAALWKEDDKQQTLLLRKLHHYTRKNSYDFFIHKDLKGFLQRELDFYIKSELVKVEDLYVLDSDMHFENIRHSFKLIKCFKTIADTIIEFLAQIEDFQKKLWEKKKFVLSTEYVITIDKLAAWLPAETFEKLATETLQNKAQIAEWQQLFGWEQLPFTLTIDGLKAGLHSWRQLPVDTKHFSAAFKEELLNALSNCINIEEESNGLVIHSDNYQSLNLLEQVFNEKIKGIYIDPPYNTGDDGFNYKDSFKSSSWLSMMNPLIDISKNLLDNEGSLFVSFDEHEEENISPLITQIYSAINKVEKITWNKRIPKNDKSIGNIHEYILVYSKDLTYRRNNDLVYKMRKDALEEVYELVRKAKNSNIALADAQAELKRFYRKNGFDRGITLYCELDKDYEIWGKINMSWPNPQSQGPRYEVINPVTGKPCPVPQNGWRWTEDTFRKAEDGKEFKLPDGSLMKGRIWYSVSETVQPSSITYLREVESFLLRSIISLKSDGSITLEDLNLKGNVDYPKPVKLIEFLLFSCGVFDGYFLDFFGGSGTTFHGLQCLNLQDSHKRKCIVVEQGNYVYTTILPRIKKIAYSFDWKEGKPQNNNGLGVFIKYQRLEQYEEALENIAFSASENTVQQAMAFDNYMPKYFLELETRGSKTLVNIAAMQNPWAYTLKVWDGFTYDTEQPADLVETFNYLIGLHVQKQFTWLQGNNKYVFVYGNSNAQQKSLVVWRNTTGWQEGDYQADREYIESKLPAFEYDYLYLNDQSTIPGYLMIEEIFKTKMIP